MSIMDSWSERVGDDLAEAKRNIDLHDATCCGCRPLLKCNERKRLNLALKKVQKAFDEFINYDEV
jgi:hypothetical protein